MRRGLDFDRNLRRLRRHHHLESTRHSSRPRDTTTVGAARHDDDERIHDDDIAPRQRPVRAVRSRVSTTRARERPARSTRASRSPRPRPVLLDQGWPILTLQDKTGAVLPVTLVDNRSGTTSTILRGKANHARPVPCTKVRDQLLAGLLDASRRPIRSATTRSPSAFSSPPAARPCR